MDSSLVPGTAKTTMSSRWRDSFISAVTREICDAFVHAQSIEDFTIIEYCRISTKQLCVLLFAVLWDALKICTISPVLLCVDTIHFFGAIVLEGYPLPKISKESKC